MSDTVLVVCAHADDEAFGAAGTLAKHAARGDTVDLLFLADGVTARQPVPDVRSMAGALTARKAMAAAAARVMGARTPRFLDLPDNRLDTVALLDIVKAVEAVVSGLAPTVVYTNHADDLNVDHRLANQAVLTACRPMEGYSVRAIYAFETLSSTEWAFSAGTAFRPSRFVDIGGFTETKLAAIGCYDAELRAFPHPRSPESVEALWRMRGAQGGLRAAEGFVVLRERA